MRYFFAFAVFAASLCEVSFLRAEEGLFSEVAMESVFAQPAASAPSVASKGTIQKLDRITSVSSLIEALKSVELEPREEKGRAKIDVEHAGWKFPVSLAVEVDQDRIVCEMSLAVIDDSAAGTETLLDLLSLGNSIDGAFFAYDRDKKLIQLRSSFTNRSITASQLKADLLKLAGFAEKHSDVWSKLKTKSKSKTKAKTGSSDTTNPSNPSPSKSAPQKLSLVGRWTASLSSGESFAIQMTSDSKFQLVHLRSGKSTISKGTATRSADRLTLTGDDAVTLNCRVEQTLADKFRLTILNTKGNAAVTLDFKKAK